MRKKRKRRTSAAWHRKPKWQCQYGLHCRRPRGRSYYCARHSQEHRASQNSNRDLRKRLGFCIYCVERAEPGYTRCRKHLTTRIEAGQRYREREKKARGWKLVRVAV